MSIYVPTKAHLRTLLLYFFNINKNASEAHRLLVEAYGDDVPSIKTCATWFQRFKSGDFDVSDKDRPGQPKKVEDAELQALLDEDSHQTQSMLAEHLGVDRSTVGKRLKAMGHLLKDGKWVPHQLNDRQAERRKIEGKIRLAQLKKRSFLNRIKSGSET